jgi:hypothetical protein
MQAEFPLAERTPLRRSGGIWEYLARTAQIAPEILEEHRRRSKKSKLFGRTLLELGLVTWSEVTSLLGIQADEPHLRLGELAVREGMCSQADLDLALGLHLRGNPHPLELLMADERLDPAHLREVLVGYVRHLEGRVGSGA